MSVIEQVSEEQLEAMGGDEGNERPAGKRKGWLAAVQWVVERRRERPEREQRE